MSDEKKKKARKPRMKVSELPPLHPWYEGMAVMVCDCDGEPLLYDEVTRVTGTQVYTRSGRAFRHHDAFEATGIGKVEDRPFLRPQTPQEAAEQEHHNNVRAVSQVPLRAALEGIAKRIGMKLGLG